MPCFPSLARAEKKLLRLAGEVARRAGGVSHPRIIPQGKQKGHYGHVGVRPPPPLWGSSSCEAGQFIPAGFDCRHSGLVETETLRTQLPQFIFPLVLNPPKCELFQGMADVGK